MWQTGLCAPCCPRRGALVSHAAGEPCSPTSEDGECVASPSLSLSRTLAWRGVGAPVQIVVGGGEKPDVCIGLSQSWAPLSFPGLTRCLSPHSCP